MKEVLVIEPHIGGHTPYILQLYGALAAVRPDYRPVWLTARPEVGNPYAAQIAQAEGVDVNLLYPPESEASWRPAGAPGRLARRLRILARMEGNALRTYREVRRRRPAVVHFQSTNVLTDTPLVWLLRRSGLPLVQTIHNVVPHKRYLGRLDHLLEGSYYRAFDRLLVHSQANGRELRARYPSIDEGSVAVVPHGNYCGQFDDPPGMAEARRRYGLPEGVPVALFFGVIRPDKGLDLLLDALALPPAANLHLLIAGKPEGEGQGFQREYQPRIDRLGLNARVHSVVRHIADEEVPAIFGACDLVVLPYRQVAMSGVLHLAYTFGKPVVASNVGSMAEVIRSGETGYLVDSADPSGLAEAMGRVVGSAEACEEMGRAARRMADEFSWESVARRLTEVYDKVLMGRGAGV